MSSFWRKVGLSYIQYSNICAQAVRNSLKPEVKAEAQKKAETVIKMTKWEGGKPVSKTAAAAAS